MTVVYIKAALVIILFLVLFYLASFILEPVLKLSFNDVSDRLVCGCLIYFFVFEIICVPMIMLKQPFHRLVIMWLVLLFLWFLVLNPLLVFKHGCGRISLQGINIISLIMITAATAAVVFLAAVSVCQRYTAWDPGYYIGTMNTTLFTDTMYLYDGADGTPEEYINLRYALSGFYMQFCIFCSILSIHARTMAWFIMRPLCVIMAGLCVYRLGCACHNELWTGFIRKERRVFAAVFVVIWAGISLYWSGTHTTAYFMIVRGYEAKGWCANVVIAAVLCAAIMLFKRKNEEEWWKRLSLACFASVPISMSSMALVPACVAIMALTLIARYGQLQKTLARATICVLPNVMIMAVYLASKFR